MINMISRNASIFFLVNLGSLEILNHQLSACGFGLHKDADRNYIFRVMYSGCFVQQEVKPTLNLNQIFITIAHTLL